MIQTTKMRYTLLFSILLLIFSTSCNKQKFGTTPSLKFVSVNTTELHNQQFLQFTLSFTDAQGDFSDTSSINVLEVVPNCPESMSANSGTYKLPSFPTSKDEKGNLVLTFQYNGSSGYTSISPQCQQNDTAFFKFTLKDNANHISDTASSPKIVLVYP